MARAPVSAHFVNNVLAAAASYIEDDPEYARDILAELGQFLSYRLRDTPGPMPAAQELAHVATYLRLQQARFPDRIQSDLSQSAGLNGLVHPGTIQRPLADALAERLSQHAGPCTLALRAGDDGLVLELGGPGDAHPVQLAISLTNLEGVPS